MSSSIWLKIDGIYGPKTQSAIEQFQLEMRRNGRSIATDGCIDPEPGDSSVSTISHTGYTISWLNKYFYLLYPERFPNLALDPECPTELRTSVGGW
jgi:peptidoglycan hydrolase-like protein with peptidoglycan-binding domain